LKRRSKGAQTKNPATRFELPDFERSGLRSDAVVPVAGLEPARHRWRWILSFQTHLDFKGTQQTFEELSRHEKASVFNTFKRFGGKNPVVSIPFRLWSFARQKSGLEGCWRDADLRTSDSSCH